MSGMNDKITGKIQQAAGKLSGDKKLESEGKANESKGDMKDKADKALDHTSNLIDDAKKKIK